MSSYAYCVDPECGAGLSRPTLEEAKAGVQFCRGGHPNATRDTFEDIAISVIGELQDRIESLEITRFIETGVAAE